MLITVGEEDFDCRIVDYQKESLMLGLSESDSICKLLPDSGASDHMLPYREWLTDVEQVPSRSNILGNESRVSSDMCGALRIQAALRGNGEIIYRTVCLRDGLLVSDLTTALISISRLCEDGYDLKFNHWRCIALRGGLIEFYGHKVYGVYKLDGEFRNMKSYAIVATVRNQAIQTLYERMVHANAESVQKLATSGAVIGQDLYESFKVRNLCSSCMKSKQTKRVL